jgi:hypothetical protein
MPRNMLLGSERKSETRECGRLEGGSRSELRTESNSLLAAIVLLAVFAGKKKGIRKEANFALLLNY